MPIELKKGLNRIGRRADNDFQILDASISGYHCELQVSEMGVAFRDVGSTNGSFINGKRVTKELLNPGSVLTLGSIDFDVDVPGVNVAIPTRPKVEESFANFLSDGTAACQKHATVAASQKCQKCEKTWCEECVRRTGLTGSANQIVSCLECGGKCAAIVYTAPKKKSFFDKIGDTMRLIKK